MADSNPRVSTQTVQRAVNSLLKWRTSRSEHQKPQLLDDDEFVYLVVTLKKIPAKDRVNSHKIALPHPLFDSASADLCLVLDDRPNSGLTKESAAAKIKSEGIPVSKVLKLSKLRSDYRPFEAKRKLCDSFDAFFADRRIVPLLPRLLGKQFFKKKKIPVPVDLGHGNWKEQIERACGSARLFLRTGTCSVVRVARVSMAAEAIAENVAAAIEGVAEAVPRKWGNVRSFHLKLLESVALPVYQALPDSRLRIEGVGSGELAVVDAGEGDGEAEEKAVGTEKKKQGKGRIREVRYMDVSGGESDIGEGESGGLGEGESGGLGEGEDGELGSGELAGKKRKKGGVADEEPRLKKSAKKAAKTEDKEGGAKRKKDGLAKKEKKEESAVKLKSGGTKLKAKKSRVVD